MTMSVDIEMTNDSDQIDEEEVRANLTRFVIQNAEGTRWCEVLRESPMGSQRDQLVSLQ
jgi:hypothetical protein